MDVSGNYLTIESIRKVSGRTLADFIAKSLYEWVEENKGDFSILENEGSDYVLYLISEYEEGQRYKP